MGTRKRICYVEPDGWKIGQLVYEDPDMPVPFNVRIETGHAVPESLAVRVQRTGRVPNRWGHYRCKITFLGDGEPDVVHHGWMSLS